MQPLGEHSMGDKSARILNGYRVLYRPDHPSAMTSSNWKGYVYEHILVVEQSLERPLTEDEVTHHLDGDKANNRLSNLLVLTRGQHSRIEHWLSCGAPSAKAEGANRMNSGKPKWKKAEYCEDYEATLEKAQKATCSEQCRKQAISSRSRRPSKHDLTQDLAENSLLAIGRKYGVSDNAVRKWMRHYRLHKAILSQAAGTPAEGAETTGEVKSS